MPIWPHGASFTHLIQHALCDSLKGHRQVWGVIVLNFTHNFRYLVHQLEGILARRRTDTSECIRYLFHIISFLYLTVVGKSWLPSNETRGRSVHVGEESQKA